MKHITESEIKNLEESRAQRVIDYNAWIIRNRALGKVGDEAWGRWVAAKYRETGECPVDPLSTNAPIAVDTQAQVVDSKTKTVDQTEPVDRKAYQREWARNKRAAGKS